jgi:hypothetical protein
MTDYRQLGFDDINTAEPVFPDPAHRIGDMETSVEAAHDAAMNASRGRMLVLRTLAQYPAGGLTDFDLAALTGWQQTSIGKRRGECVAAGLVRVLKRDDGNIQKRAAPSGSMASVWVITIDGLSYIDKHAGES